MAYNFDLSNQFAAPAPQFALTPPPAGAQGNAVANAMALLGGGGGGASMFGSGNDLLQALARIWEGQKQAPQLTPEALERIMAANRETLQNIYTSQPRPEEVEMARAKGYRYGKDPYRAATSEMDAARARGETPNIDAFKRINRIPEMSPAAILASQGNTALNQWARAGGVPSVDPNELARLNAYTYQARNNAGPGNSYYLPQGRYT